jgi:head-tail adaptor
MVRAGDMRHQFQIQRRSSTRDAAGEQVLTWIEFASRRAAIQRTPGAEVFASAQRNGRIPTVVRMRFVAGVTPAMRIVGLCPCHLNKVFDIKDPTNVDGRGEELVIVAEEIVGEAP